MFHVGGLIVAAIADSNPLVRARAVGSLLQHAGNGLAERGHGSAVSGAAAQCNGFRTQQGRTLPAVGESMQVAEPSSLVAASSSPDSSQRALARHRLGVPIAGGGGTPRSLGQRHERAPVRQGGNNLVGCRQLFVLTL